MICLGIAIALTGLLPAACNFTFLDDQQVKQR